MNEIIEQEDIIVCILEYLNIEEVYKIGFTSTIFYKLSFFLLKKQISFEQISILKSRMNIFKFLIFNIDRRYIENWNGNEETEIELKDRYNNLISNKNVWHSFRGNFKIKPNNGKIIKWSVILEDIPWYSSNSWKVVLGIQQETFKTSLAVNESGYGFAIFEGVKIHKSDQGNLYYKQGIKKNGDKISIILDCKNNSFYNLSFQHNNIHLGIAFNDIPGSNIIWYPYFALHGDCKIKYELDYIY